MKQIPFSQIYRHREKVKQVVLVWKKLPLNTEEMPLSSAKPPIFDNLLTFSNDYSHYFGEVTN